MTSSTTMLTEKLSQIIKDCWADFQQLKELPSTVNPSIPILWFGDLEKYWNSPLRILTVATNPSSREFSEDGEPPYSVGLRFNGAEHLVDKQVLEPEDVATYYAVMNGYFHPDRRPYRRWFRAFERVLKRLDVSFFGRCKNTAIHIDVCTPVATMNPWSKVKERNLHKPYLIQEGCFRKLLEEFAPHVILASDNAVSIRSAFGIDYRNQRGEIVDLQWENDTVLIIGYKAQIPFMVNDDVLDERMSEIRRNYPIFSRVNNKHEWRAVADTDGRKSQAEDAGKVAHMLKSDKEQARTQNKENDRGQDQNLAQYEHLNRLKLWKNRQHQRNALVVNIFLKLFAECPVGERSVRLDAFQQAIDEAYGDPVHLHPFTHAYPNNDALIFVVNGNTCTIREAAWNKLVEIGWTQDLRPHNK